MAIEIKEYVGSQILNVTSKPFNPNFTEGYVQTYMDEDNSIMTDIESIHSIITRNNTLYEPDCLKESEKYWTYPYEVPVIMHHNEKNGQIIGRVKAAKYLEYSERSKTPALEFTANIGDPEGVKGVKNGTLATVSIGVIAHDIRCSICGTNLVEEGMCEHEKGETYDNELCYWRIKKIEPKEVSYVVVPSDIYAHNTKVYETKKSKKNKEVNESMYDNIFAELIESTKPKTKPIEQEEGNVIEEEVVEKAKVKATEGSKEENPKEENPKEENPKEENPKEENPKEENPKEENPKEENPKEENPKEENPKEEGSKEEGSKEEGSKEENPKEEGSKELEEANKTIENLKKELSDIKIENSKLIKRVENEKGLKESAETELIKFRAIKKQALVEAVNNLRASLSLELENVESLSESTDEQLEVTIKNLKEFVTVNKRVGSVQLLESPVAVSDEKDNTNNKIKKKVNVQESTKDSNITIEEAYLNLFKDSF